MKDYIKKLRRNAKALSPIFAVLILIAIAVIGGIVIYMFTSGYLGTMMGGGSAGQEKLAIETVSALDDGTVVAYVKCTGGGDIELSDAILKDASGNTIEVIEITATVLASGAMEPVDCTFTGTGVTAGYTYTVTLISQVGNQFVSPSFKAVVAPTP
jgi:flagellin-like protein